MTSTVRFEIEKIYQAESRRVLASLVRILGDLDLAEEALQEAFFAAIKTWPDNGIPKNPYAWLVSAGKFRAIDAIRRQERGNELMTEKLSFDRREFDDEAPDPESHQIEDDRLRLIFYCCHPSLPIDSRVALSLREVCAMKTEEIAQAYLVPVETVKKRISRAKAFIKENKISYELPSRSELTLRLDAVLHVIYLIYNEGYSATSGEELIRRELTDEAIFLSRYLTKLVATSESLGLLALLLLQESRKAARVTDDGDLVPLEEQDRSLWNRSFIEEGTQIVQQAVLSGRMGPYSLQAAIASVHALADSVQSTRWDLIVGYYDLLLAILPSPVVEFNRAIAVGMDRGPQAGLTLIEQLMKEKKLNSSHRIHSARAEFLKQLGKTDQAIGAYREAIARVRQAPEKRYLTQQLAKILK